MWKLLIGLCLLPSLVMAQDLVVQITIPEADIPLLVDRITVREVPGETPEILIRSQIDLYMQKLRKYRDSRHSQREQSLIQDFRRQSEERKQMTEAEAKR